VLAALEAVEKQGCSAEHAPHEDLSTRTADTPAAARQADALVELVGRVSGPSAAEHQRPDVVTRARGATRLSTGCENGRVPWCAGCSRYLSPPTVRPDGTCPACGRTVDAGRARTTTGDEPVPLPWHLKLLAAAVVLYLGYRAWEGVEWVIGRF
jgi:hypothetical protein